MTRRHHAPRACVSPLRANLEIHECGSAIRVRNRLLVQALSPVWEVPPCTPELRAERESLSLLHILRAHAKPQSEWLNAITSDQTLSAPVRQRALPFAREWK